MDKKEKLGFILGYTCAYSYVAQFHRSTRLAPPPKKEVEHELKNMQLGSEQAHPKTGGRSEGPSTGTTDGILIEGKRFKRHFHTHSARYLEEGSDR